MRLINAILDRNEWVIFKVMTKKIIQTLFRVRWKESNDKIGFKLQGTYEQPNYASQVKKYFLLIHTKTQFKMNSNFSRVFLKFLLLPTVDFLGCNLNCKNSSITFPETWSNCAVKFAKFLEWNPPDACMFFAYFLMSIFS